MRNYNNISTLYVSPEVGPGYNGMAPESDGKGSGPIGSIEAALDYVMQLRRSGVMQPITIQLRGGVYELKNPIDITSGYGIVSITSYADENAVISGGTLLTDVKWDEFRGVKCLSAAVPALPDDAAFNDLYVNGLRAELPRYPESGEIPVINAENTKPGLFVPSKWFEVDPALLSGLAPDTDLTQCLVTALHYWIDEHSPIEAFDRSRGRITMKYPSRFNMMNNTGCYFENVPCCFGKVNSFYYSRKAGRVYYVPRDGVTAENAVMYFPRLDRLINVTGTEDAHVRNFTIKGVTLAHTKSDYVSRHGTMGEDDDEYASDAQAVCNAHASVNFTYAENCAVEDCLLTELGIHAVNINKGCSYIRVCGNRIYDCGGGGVKINGSSASQPESGRTHSNTVSDNSIIHCGRRHMASCGVLMQHTYCNTVSHNEIADIFYTGVSAGWIWGYTDSVARDNIIEKNHIHNLGQGLQSDMGGVYLLGAQPGTVVRGNLIHDIKSRKYGGWALYTDEGSGYITLENNVCYNTSDNSYHQHYGRMNVVRNNIFAFSQKELLTVSRYEGHLSIIFENNILLSNGTPMYKLSQNHIASGTVGSGGNLFWDISRAEPVVYAGFENPLFVGDMKEFGMDCDSAAADPLFKDAENYDFTLSADSPAFKLGFKAIDMSDVGPRN
nr:right-handed parallel beta-helix repeat-containing protein [Clostridia bacterium]